MRRPEVELSEDAAAFVERHPAIVERLASAADRTHVAVAPTDVHRQRLRARLQECREFAASPEGRASGEAFLARFRVS